MDNKLIYIPNDDIQNYPFFRLQLEDETLKQKNKKPSKFNKNPQNCRANEKEKCIWD